MKAQRGAQRVIIHKIQYRDTRGRFVCTPGKACKTKSYAKKKPCKKQPDGPYIEVRERQTAFTGPRLEFYYHDPELEKHEREARRARDYNTLKEIREIKRKVLDGLIEHYREQQSGADIDNPYDEREAMRQYELEARARKGAEGRIRYLERVKSVENKLMNKSDAEIREAAREARTAKDTATLQAIRRILKKRGYGKGDISIIAPKLKFQKRRGKR